MCVYLYVSISSKTLPSQKASVLKPSMTGTGMLPGRETKWTSLFTWMCIYICMYTHISTWTCIRTYVYIYKYTLVYSYAHVKLCECIDPHLHRYVYILTNIITHNILLMCTHIYIYTYVCATHFQTDGTRNGTRNGKCKVLQVSFQRGHLKRYLWRVSFPILDPFHNGHIHIHTSLPITDISL